MALQKQFKRKDLKKPDLLHVLTIRLFNYYEKSKWTLIAAVCGAVVVAAGVWAYQYNRQIHEREMEGLYFKMVKVWTNKKDKSIGTAIAQLQDIAAKIDDTNVKQRASLLLADAFFESKNFDRAIPLYTRVQEKSKVGQLDYDLARVGLGYSLEAKMEYNKAIEVYKSVVSSNTNYPLFYIYLGMARCHSLSGDPKNAQLVLRETLNKFPDHGHIAKAKTMLKNIEDSA